jgi:hypothetical protein
MMRLALFVCFVALPWTVETFFGETKGHFTVE